MSQSVHALVSYFGIIKPTSIIVTSPIGDIEALSNTCRFILESSLLRSIELVMIDLTSRDAIDPDGDRSIR